MRSLRIYSFNNFQIHYTAVNYSHVVHYIPCTYLSYKWKFVQHCKINLTLYSICCFYPFLTFLLEYNWLTMYSFRSTVKWICYTYTYVHSFLDYFPIKAITQYWAELVFILWFLLSLYCKYFLLSLGFPGGIVVKYLPVGKRPWKKKWQPTPGILAWEIPWTEENGGLQSMEWQRIRHTQWLNNSNISSDIFWKHDF